MTKFDVILNSKRDSLRSMKRAIDIQEDQREMLKADFRESNDLSDLVQVSQITRDLANLKSAYNKARRYLDRYATAIRFAS